MGNKVDICHWNEAGSWEALSLPPQALEAQGHPGHEMDIWPPVPDVTPGLNWPRGEPIYINGCSLPATTPSPEPSASPSLPDTGATAYMLLIALVLVVAGTFAVCFRGRYGRAP